MKKRMCRTVSIGEAARLTNVSIKQIRHWAECGYISEPERVICGKRSYRQFVDQDLKVIARIKELMNQGYTLRAAAMKAANNEKGGR